VSFRSPQLCGPKSYDEGAEDGARLKRAPFARCPIIMRVFSLPRDHLLILDNALHGHLSDALAEVARDGGDPILFVERIRPTDGSPSSWRVVVSGGAGSHRFEVKTPAGLGVAAQVYLKDLVAEMSADLSARVRAEKAAEQMEFDFHDLWSRWRQGDPS